MLSKRRENHQLVREKALAESVRKVAAELRLVDLVDFISYVRNEQFANIEDLVNSSLELYFKPGTLTFGWGADVSVDWAEPPQVTLDMEFRHMAVTVFFGLTLEANHAGVGIRYVAFEHAAENPEENTQRLVEALADARLKTAAADGQPGDLGA